MKYVQIKPRFMIPFSITLIEMKYMHGDMCGLHIENELSSVSFLSQILNGKNLEAY